MDADQKLRKRVGWLNNQGGFNNALIADKVQEAAWGLEISGVMRVLKELEEKKDQVKDPTAWVTSSLRKLGGGKSGRASPAAAYPQPMALPGVDAGGYGGMGGCWMPAADDGHNEDQQVRRKIGWLNKTGGFDGQVNYTKIIEAAKGLEYSKVLDLLQQLEQKRGEIKDPTAWVCNALRKAGGGSGFGGGFGAFTATAMPPAQPGFGFASPPPSGRPPVDADSKLRKRIDWLNSEGGFAGAIDQDKIYNAAKGLEISVVMKVLKELEEKKATVKDPNAYAGAALRKMGGGGRGMPASDVYMAAPAPPAPAYPSANFADAGFGGGSGWGDAQSEDQKLRKKIGWLNNAGGFDGAIHYQKIVDAARGLEYAEVFKVLQRLEEKPRGTINDPTGWVCAGLRKSAGGGGGSPAAGFSMGGSFSHQGPPFGGGGGFNALDPESDAKLRRRIGWLNKAGGFENALNYQKVAEAAAGVQIGEVMEILKDVEAKKDQVQDPTAYATSAIRKRRAGGGGGGPNKRMRM